MAELENAETENDYMKSTDIENKDAENIEDLDDSEESRPNESKNEKFLRLAEARTNKTMISIRKIANLANKLNYKYSQEEVDQMFSAIEEETQSVKEQFITQEKQANRFRFQ